MKSKLTKNNNSSIASRIRRSRSKVTREIEPISKGYINNSFTALSRKGNTKKIKVKIRKLSLSYTNRVISGKRNNNHNSITIVKKTKDASMNKEDNEKEINHNSLFGHRLFMLNNDSLNNSNVLLDTKKTSFYDSECENDIDYKDKGNNESNEDYYDNSTNAINDNLSFCNSCDCCHDSFYSNLGNRTNTNNVTNDEFADYSNMIIEDGDGNEKENKQENKEKTTTQGNSNNSNINNNIGNEISNNNYFHNDKNSNSDSSSSHNKKTNNKGFELSFIFESDEEKSINEKSNNKILGIFDKSNITVNKTNANTNANKSKILFNTFKQEHKRENNDTTKKKHKYKNRMSKKTNNNIVVESSIFIAKDKSSNNNVNNTNTNINSNNAINPRVALFKTKKILKKGDIKRKRKRRLAKNTNLETKDNDDTKDNQCNNEAKGDSVEKITRLFRRLRFKSIKINKLEGDNKNTNSTNTNNTKSIPSALYNKSNVIRRINHNLFKIKRVIKDVNKTTDTNRAIKKRGRKKKRLRHLSENNSIVVIDKDNDNSTNNNINHDRDNKDIKDNLKDVNKDNININSINSKSNNYESEGHFEIVIDNNSSNSYITVNDLIFENNTNNNFNININKVDNSSSNKVESHENYNINEIDDDEDLDKKNYNNKNNINSEKNYNINWIDDCIGQTNNIFKVNKTNNINSINKNNNKKGRQVDLKISNKSRNVIIDINDIDDNDEDIAYKDNNKKKTDMIKENTNVYLSKIKLTQSNNISNNSFSNSNNNCSNSNNNIKSLNNDNEDNDNKRLIKYPSLINLKLKEFNKEKYVEVNTIKYFSKKNYTKDDVTNIYNSNNKVQRYKKYKDRFYSNTNLNTKKANITDTIDSDDSLNDSLHTLSSIDISEYTIEECSLDDKMSRFNLNYDLIIDIAMTFKDHYNNDNNYMNNYFKISFKDELLKFTSKHFSTIKRRSFSRSQLEYCFSNKQIDSFIANSNRNSNADIHGKDIFEELSFVNYNSNCLKRLYQAFNKLNREDKGVNSSLHSVNNSQEKYDSVGNYLRSINDLIGNKFQQDLLLNLLHAFDYNTTYVIQMLFTHLENKELHDVKFPFLTCKYFI